MSSKTYLQSMVKLFTPNFLLLREWFPKQISIIKKTSGRIQNLIMRISRACHSQHNLQTQNISLDAMYLQQKGWEQFYVTMLW